MKDDKVTNMERKEPQNDHKNKLTVQTNSKFEVEHASTQPTTTTNGQQRNNITSHSAPKNATLMRNQTEAEDQRANAGTIRKTTAL